MNTALTLTYVLTVFLLIATPGPVVALVVDTASRAGRRQAVATALGSNAGSLVLIGVAVWMIISSVALEPRLLAVLGLLGCVVIAHLAWTLLRAPAAPPTPVATPATSHPGGWHRGFMVAVSNPKDILFFMAFFPQFLAVTRSIEASLAVLLLLWVAIDLLVLGAWMLLAGSLARRVGSRWVSRCSGLALALVAGTGLLYNLHSLMVK